MRVTSIGGELYRPVVDRLIGSRKIGSYFKTNPELGALARAARKLMDASPEAEELTYRAVEEDWVHDSPSQPPLANRASQGPRSSELESQVARLRGQIDSLTVLQEQLLVRLATLESKMLRGHFEQPRQTLREPTAVPPPVRVAPQVSHAAPAAVPPPSPPAVAENQANSPALAPPETELVALDLPPTFELAKCIALLVGNGVSAREVPPIPVTRATRDHFAAQLLSDAGEQVGLILMDLKATVFLGGTLMMVPKAQLEQQCKAFEPEEDSIAASGEICNALSGTINEKQAHHHVRVSSLEKFDLARAPWASDPLERRDLEDSMGGRTVVLSRRFMRGVPQKLT